jgi:hypothetical protein
MTILSRSPFFHPSLLFSVCLIGATAALAEGIEERDFLAENNAAMAKMMTAMSVAPSGDVDQDFVAMMVPHHQGAIEMAQAQLRYGRNEQLRRLAQEIIVTQRDEIAAMRFALGQPLLPSAPSPNESLSPVASDAQARPDHAMPMPREP